MSDKIGKVQTLDELEKSWNDSRDTVKALLGEEDTLEVVEKALTDDEIEALEKSEDKVSQDGEDDDSESDDDEEEEVDDKEAEGVKKSLEDSMDLNPDASAAMDVEPFLRELVKGIDTQFSSIQTMVTEISERTDALQKSTDEANSLQKATAKLVMTYGDLQKSMSETVEAIGNAPKKTSTVLRKSGEKYPETKEEAVMPATKDAILQKATKLREEGKLSVRDVTKLENRLNKGIEIPEYIQNLLKEEK